MENTIENKEKFFALYWGQEVLKLNEKSQLWRVFGFEDEEGNNITKTSFLELKPLSSITDEECLYIAELFGIEKGTVNYQKKIDYIKNWINERDKNITRFPKDNNTEVIWEVASYLRLKGYALPYMGLSVEKQIEYSWIRLKSE